MNSKLKKLENLVVILCGETNYYGLNILNSLIKSGFIPKAVLLEKTPKKGFVTTSIENFIRIYKKAGLLKYFSRISRRITVIFGKLGFIDEWTSYKTFKLAAPRLKHFEYGLKLDSFDFDNLGVDLILCGNNSDETVEYINNNKIKIVIGSPRIIFGKTLNNCNADFVNAHPAYLPYIRGKHSEFWQIIYGVTPGATIHFMSKALDAGKIIEKKTFPLEENDTWASLRLKGKDVCVDLYLKNIEDLCLGKINFDELEPQDYSIGKKSFGINLKDFLIARKRLKTLKAILKARKSLKIKNQGSFFCDHL